MTDFSQWLLIPFGHITVDLGAGWQELVLALVPSFAEGQQMARDEANAPPGDARLSLSGGSLRMRAFVVSGGSVDGWAGIRSGQWHGNALTRALHFGILSLWTVVSARWSL